jgi:hypothetical protein
MAVFLLDASEYRFVTIPLKQTVSFGPYHWHYEITQERALAAGLDNVTAELGMIQDYSGGNTQLVFSFPFKSN